MRKKYKIAIAVGLVLAIATLAWAGTPSLRKYGIRFSDEGAAHNTPPSGYYDLFVNGDALYGINDAGTTVNLSSTAATAWDDIGNPDANKTLTFSTYTTTLTGAGTAADQFTIQGTGAFGDVSILKVQQTTGNPTDGTVLEVISADTDADALIVTANSATRLSVAGSGNVSIVGLTGTIDYTDFDVSADGALVLAGDDGGTQITLSPSAAAIGIDASDTDITTALSVGANDIVGTTGLINYTNFDVDAAGAVVCTALDAGAGTIQTTGDLTVTGTANIGTWAQDAIVPASAGATITLNGSGVGGVNIGSTSTGAITLGSTVTVADGKDVTIGEGKLLVDNDANETAVEIQSSSTTTGSPLLITASTTTGSVISATADDLGSAGKMIYLDSDNMAADNFYLYLYNGTTPDFTVGRYGAAVIAGNASTDILTVTAGDVQITAGDIDLDNGQIMVDTAQDLANNISRNFAGAGTSPTLTVAESNASSTNSALSVSNAGTAGTALTVTESGTGNATGIALVHSGDYPALNITAGAARTGDVIDIDMTNQVAEKALAISGAWTGTAAEGLIELHTTGQIAATGSLLRLDADTAKAEDGSDGYILNIDDDTVVADTPSVYAMLINSASNEALHVASGLSLFDETVTFTAGITNNGNTTLGNAVTDGTTLTAAILGATPFVLDGNTDDTNTLSIAVADFSTAKTLTLDDLPADGGLPVVVGQGYTQTSQAGAGTADVTGSSLTLADGWFTEGRTLKYTVGGTVTGANAAISVKLYFEDEAICTLTTTDGAAGDWEAEFTIVAVAAANQRIIGKLIAEGGVENKVDYVADTTDTAAAGTIPIKVQITSGNAGDTITSEYVRIDFWNRAD